ncbi:hypothetical protein JAAARDRAFT_348100 [Jaapia argillacea MUCL 33604]|uniref:Uncharacterized protein n=1 Tax=Jaapia argillacea MUCL 33604 TaxID=933084 RepID=A0A067PLQ2_9AGAM|nr:hypothetical protein JAAARDRAFT_348100 [Jaapia argillacea MUCL 33604]
MISGPLRQDVPSFLISTNEWMDDWSTAMGCWSTALTPCLRRRDEHISSQKHQDPTGRSCPRGTNPWPQRSFFHCSTVIARRHVSSTYVFLGSSSVRSCRVCQVSWKDHIEACFIWSLSSYSFPPDCRSPTIQEEKGVELAIPSDIFYVGVSLLTEKPFSIR